MDKNFCFCAEIGKIGDIRRVIFEMSSELVGPRDVIYALLPIEMSGVKTQSFEDMQPKYFSDGDIIIYISDSPLSDGAKETIRGNARIGSWFFISTESIGLSRREKRYSLLLNIDDFMRKLDNEIYRRRKEKQL